MESFKAIVAIHKSSEVPIFSMDDRGLKADFFGYG
jgi:hypothetical protein